MFLRELREPERRAAERVVAAGQGA
jgi:hypothetical protein